MRPARLETVDPTHGHADRRIDLTGLNLLHPLFEVAFHLQLTDHEPGNDRDQKAHAEVQRRDFPPKQAKEQHQRDLIDHRRRDQEGKGHPQRHAGREETNEKRHGRARAERGYDPEHRRQHVADTNALA